MVDQEFAFERPDFAERYLAHRDHSLSLNTLIDVPEVMRLLGRVQGRRLLEIGTGNGELAHCLVQNGALRVHSVDRSQYHVMRARERWGHDNIEFQCARIEECAFVEGAFDAVVSSLTFHFIRDIETVLQSALRWTAPGGLLVFSTRHPIRTSDPNGQRGECDGWLVKGYSGVGERQFCWLGENIEIFHRTFAEWFKILTQNGWGVDAVSETDARHVASISENDRVHAPLFLSFRCKKAP